MYTFYNYFVLFLSIFANSYPVFYAQRGVAQSINLAILRVFPSHRFHVHIYAQISIRNSIQREIIHRSPCTGITFHTHADHSHFICIRLFIDTHALPRFRRMLLLGIRPEIRIMEINADASLSFSSLLNFFLISAQSFAQMVAHISFQVSKICNFLSMDTIYNSPKRFS